MEFKDFRPMIWTENFEETVSFYCDVLEFELDERNDDWGWASFSKNQVGIMISKPNRHVSYEKIGFSGSFYFNVNEVEKLWEKLNGKCKVCYPLETFEWGMKEFAIFDNNGYILQFGEDCEEN